MKTPITICIVDDHAIVRQGLRELLERMNNYKVIHEFDNGINFLESIPLNPKPDIYIVDYSMPFKSGIEVLKELENKEEEFKVLLLTQNYDDALINAAYFHGARGFLHKNCTAQDLNTTLQRIFSIGYDNIHEILKRIKEPENRDFIIPENINLTEKETEFLELICDEKEFTYEQIAHLMNTSLKSIENYRAALFEKYKIKSKVGLVLFSYKYKLTKPFK